MKKLTYNYKMVDHDRNPKHRSEPEFEKETINLKNSDDFVESFITNFLDKFILWLDIYWFAWYKYYDVLFDNLKDTENVYKFLSWDDEFYNKILNSKLVKNNRIEENNGNKYIDQLNNLDNIISIKILEQYYDKYIKDITVDEIHNFIYDESDNHMYIIEKFLNSITDEQIKFWILEKWISYNIEKQYMSAIDWLDNYQKGKDYQDKNIVEIIYFRLFEKEIMYHNAEELLWIEDINTKLYNKIKSDYEYWIIFIKEYLKRSLFICDSLTNYNSISDEILINELSDINNNIKDDELSLFFTGKLCFDKNTIYLKTITDPETEEGEYQYEMKLS